MGNECPYDLEFDEWGTEVETLKELLASQDDNAGDVLSWFVGHYPKLMALVPSRRRAQFIAGVRRAYDEDDIDL